MTEYHVVWRIELDADTPEEAAIEARRIMLDPESEATVFQVAPFAEYLSLGDKADFRSYDANPEEGCEYCHESTFGGSCSCDE